MDNYPIENDCTGISDEDKAYIQNALKAKIKLSSGEERYFLSYAPPKERCIKGKRRIVCHLCTKSNMFSKADLKKHLYGKEHKNNLALEFSRKKFRRPHRILDSFQGSDPIYFKMYAGEDIPFASSKYDSRFVCEAWGNTQDITKRKITSCKYNEPAHIFNERKPLIGLDYIILMPYGDQIIRFCAICNLYFDLCTYEHVISVYHEEQYIMKHFAQSYREVACLLQIPDLKKKQKALQHIFRSLYQKCERKNGLKRVTTADYKAFQANKGKFVQPILEKSHYDENTLEKKEMETLMLTLINKCNNGEKFPRYPACLPILSNRGLSLPLLKATFWKQVKYTKNTNRDWQSYANSKKQKWDDLLTKYNAFNEKAELHPDYKLEWEAYYVKTCEILKNDGIPIRGYDFERDWFPHWEKYKEEAFQKEWDKIKKKLRKSFSLPLHITTPDASPSRNENSSEYEESIYSEHEEKMNPGDHENIVGFDRKPLAWKHEKSVELLPILRILAALEDQLGSLAPKCMELLGETVFKEKNNETGELLEDKDNLIFFATVSEKLKGLLLTHSIASERIETVNQLVNDLDNLVSKMEEHFGCSEQTYQIGNSDFFQGSRLKSDQINDNRTGLQRSNASLNNQHSSTFQNLNQNDQHSNRFRSNANFQNSNQNNELRNPSRSNANVQYSNENYTGNPNQSTKRCIPFRGVEKDVINVMHDDKANFGGNKYRRTEIPTTTVNKYKWYRSESKPKSRQNKFNEDQRGGNDARITDKPEQLKTTWGEEYNNRYVILNKSSRVFKLEANHSDVDHRRFNNQDAEYGRSGPEKIDERIRNPRISQNVSKINNEVMLVQDHKYGQGYYCEPCPEYENAKIASHNLNYEHQNYRRSPLEIDDRTNERSEGRKMNRQTFKSNDNVYNNRYLTLNKLSRAFKTNGNPSAIHHMIPDPDTEYARTYPEIIYKHVQNPTVLENFNKTNNDVKYIQEHKYEQEYNREISPEYENEQTPSHHFNYEQQNYRRSSLESRNQINPEIRDQEFYRSTFKNSYKGTVAHDRANNRSRSNERLSPSSDSYIKRPKYRDHPHSMPGTHKSAFRYERDYR